MSDSKNIPTDQAAPELLPCKCGWRPVVHGSFDMGYLIAHDCEHVAAFRTSDNERGPVIAAWNRRADLVAPSEPADQAGRWETDMEHTARDMREGRFPERSERQRIAIASAPAEVEGLVAALIKADRGHDPGTLFTEAATALTTLQAENERLRKDRDALDRKWTTAVQLAAHAHNTEGDPGVLIDAANARAEAAEAERDELLAAIGDWARPTGANGMTTPSEHHPLMVARAKIKGDV